MEKRIINNVPLEKIVKSFSNKYRIRILEMLDKDPELSVAGISKRLGMDIKVVSFHLLVMASAGIILKRYRGTMVLHKVSKRGILILKFLRILE